MNYQDNTKVRLFNVHVDTGKTSFTYPKLSAYAAKNLIAAQRKIHPNAIFTKTEVAQAGK